MRDLLALCAMLFLSLTAVAEELVRNPFWPQDYQGRRYPITETPRYPSQVPAAKAPAETETEDADDGGSVTQSLKKASAPARYTSEDAENALWHDAQAALRFSDVFTFEVNGQRRQTIRINGFPYVNGDLLSVNHGPRRFTWLVLGLGSNDTVRLQRMRQRELTPTEMEKSASRANNK